MATAAGAATGPLGYYRQPDVSGQHVVFVAEGDLWTVDANGGLADRLTSHSGDEAHPTISPDGTRVAFVATYEGPSEIYVMPIAGGLPTRLTFDGTAVETVRWLDDSRILFSSRGRSTLPNMQLFALDLSDPARTSVTPVPLSQAADGVYTPDGALIFTRQAFQGSHAKRYQGGTVQQLWRWDGGEQEARGLTTDFPGTSRQPMWWNGRIYFASDRDGTMNIWSIAPDGSALRQHTRHVGFDVLNPALGTGLGTGLGSSDGQPGGDGARIVYQLGADLRVLDLPSDEDRLLQIALRSDLDQTREQWIAKPSEFISSAHVAPDGKRVAITARGRVFVAPARPGRLIDVDRDGAVRWRDARFVPQPKPVTKEKDARDGDAAEPEGGQKGENGEDAKAPVADAAPPAPPAPPQDAGQLVALSDRSGEVELWTLPADGVPVPPNEPTQRTRDGSVLRWFAIPSPDGTLVAHTDKNQRLWILNLATGENRLATQSLLGDIEEVAWAPDSRWLTFTAPAENSFRQVSLLRVDDLSLTALTSDRFDSYASSWSPDGKWIYFISDRHLVTIVESPWGPYQPEPFMAKTGKLYALALKPGERFPFMSPDELHPESPKDDKKPAEKKPAEKTPDPKPDEKPDEKKPSEKVPPAPVPAPPPTPITNDTPLAPQSQVPASSTVDAKPAVGAPSKGAKTSADKPVEIVLEAIAERLHVVPVPPGSYSALSVGPKTLFWLSSDPITKTRTLSALEIGPPEQGATEPKVVAVAEKVSSYELSLDGSTLLINRENTLHLAPAKAAAADLPKTTVDLSGWTLSIVPREQWRRMFLDAWRLHRDHFYDPGMHGVDWAAMRDKFLPLVDRVTTRAELSDVLAQMIGELSALHASVRGGDLRRGSDQIRAGELGAVLERDEAAGGWRVATVYAHDPDEPGDAPPLSRPESRVEVGEVIVRINGVPTLSVPDPAVLLRGTIGKQVLLHVKGATTAAAASGEAPTAPPAPANESPEAGLRRVLVKPVSSAQAAGYRYSDWELSRRREVERAGEGRLGYVHLRAMGEEDWTDWAKGYFPAYTKDGLIIDVRHNRGGNIDSWIIGRLLRKAWMGWSNRVGEPPLWNMQYAFRGHVVVLCDEWTASDGEAFAEGVKRLKIGPVIGTRTWGGEIWLSGSNLLVDKGIATAAEFGVFGPEGTWLVEGHGVEPDVVVDNLPRETFAGRDRQLEAAIEYLKKKIAEEPVPPLKRPAFPVKAPP